MEENKKKAAAVGAGIAVALALIWALRAGAQQPDLASLWGHVTDADTNQPVSGINVACNGYGAQTNGNGYYRILNIEPGSYTVEFTDPQGRYLPETI